MPLTPHLQEEGVVFDPDMIELMTRAYLDACRALKLSERDDPVTRLVAKRIIDAAKDGERDPRRLFEHGLADGYSAN